MTNKLRLPHYLSQTVRHEISELFYSTAIADFAIAVISLFEPIFLYSVLHFPLKLVLLFMGAIYAFYIILIPWGAKVSSRYGYKHAILFSIPFQILYWLFLFGSKDYFTLIYWAPLFYAIEKALFWPAFHASVARFARHGQRGREFSILYAIINLVTILGPFLGGFLLERFGFWATFFAGSGLYACSFIPLFLTKEVFVPKLYQFRDTWQLYKNSPKKFLGYMGFGEELLVLNIWPIFIFIIVGANYESTGGLVTIATLVATVLALYVGKISDLYSKRVLIKIGAFFYFLVWLARLVANNFWNVFFIDSLSRTSKDLVFIPLSTVTYERAEANHVLPYVVFFEQSLSVGKFLSAMLGIGIIGIAGLFGFSLNAQFMILFILAGLFSLLYMFV